MNGYHTATGDEMGKLTDTRIRTAKAAGNDLWLTDDMHVRGAGRLVLRVKLGGSKLFYYRYTGTDGKRVHYAIGPYKSDGDGLASFTLDQARTRCAELVKIRSDHGDVHGYLEAEKRERSRQRREQVEAEARAALRAQSQSFGRLLEFYIEHLKREGKYSADEVRRALRLHVFDVPEWQELREKRAADIRPQDIRAIVRRMTDAGIRRQADKVRSFLRAAFSLGAEHAETFCIEQNPVAAIKRVRGANQKGDRVLSADELRAFWQELEGASPMLRDSLRLAIVLGGQRFAQLLRIRPRMWTSMRGPCCCSIRRVCANVHENICCRLPKRQPTYWRVPWRSTEVRQMCSRPTAAHRSTRARYPIWCTRWPCAWWRRAVHGRCSVAATCAALARRCTPRLPFPGTCAPSCNPTGWAACRPRITIGTTTWLRNVRR